MHLLRLTVICLIYGASARAQTTDDTTLAFFAKNDSGKSAFETTTGRTLRFQCNYPQESKIEIGNVVVHRKTLVLDKNGKDEQGVTHSSPFKEIKEFKIEASHKFLVTGSDQKIKLESVNELNKPLRQPVYDFFRTKTGEPKVNGPGDAENLQRRLDKEVSDSFFAETAHQYQNFPGNLGSYFRCRALKGHAASRGRSTNPIFVTFKEGLIQGVDFSKISPAGTGTR